MEWIELIVRVVHAVVGAVWLGSIYFSLMVLHRQSPELFDTLQEFEEYVTGLSDGNRWRVMSAVGTTGVTGLILMALSTENLGDPLWLAIMGVKIAALLATFGVFCYVSWRLWPERVFAVGDEIPALQRKGTILRATMFTFVSLSFILGIVVHAM